MDTATMYNRHMPPHTAFRPLPQEDDRPQNKNSRPVNRESNSSNHTQYPSKQKPPDSDLLGELTGGIRDTLGSVFKDFSFKNLDSGDILLLLIILFLFLEGDNLDLVIALGLMFLLGFGSESQPST